MQKACTKCGIEKDLEAFYRQSRSKDGRGSWCRICARTYAKDWRESNPEYGRCWREANPEYGRRWKQANAAHCKEKNRQWTKANCERKAEACRRWREANPEKVAEMSRRWYETSRWYETNRERVIEASRRWAAANPEKIAEKARRYAEKHPKASRAHRAVCLAVKVGKLVRPDVCEGCGHESYVEGHHTDYSRPLDVVWLCRSCHGKAHRLKSVPLQKR